MDFWRFSPFDTGECWHKLATDYLHEHVVYNEEPGRETKISEKGPGKNLEIQLT